MSTVAQPKPTPVWRTAASKNSLIGSYLVWGLLALWLAVHQQWWSGSGQAFLHDHGSALLAFAIWPWFYAVTITQLPPFLNRQPYVALYGRANRLLPQKYAYWYNGIMYALFFSLSTLFGLVILFRSFGS